MIIIVAYHCVCYYGIWDEEFPYAYKYENIETFRFICILALQIFTFISGYLYAKGRHKDLKTIIKNKSIRLLVPYFFWSVVVACIFPFERSWMYLLCGMWHLWFLLMLFVCFVIVTAIKFYTRKLRMMIFFVVAISACNWFINKYNLNSNPNYFAYQSVLNYIPYFLSGIAISKYELFKSFQKFGKFRLTLFFMLTTLILFMYHLRGGFPLSTMYMWIVVASFICCLYVLAGKIVNNEKICPPHLLNSLDKTSMGIYLIHHILIYIFLIYVPYATSIMDNHPYISPCILFVCVLLLSHILVSFMSRFIVISFLMGVLIKEKK